ncbi:uncharacterized protein LOC112496029 [Citrus sinensis]|uniref:uncharacterized protein LOC112496029 n=1 Tax=Citrus sinensis TaxID=2711 RepID=UPI00227773D6|nr:uncharacterized protein LOC112496029 [Citrus sinensis]
MTFNLAAVRYELGELKRNNLDTYALVQKMYSAVEALEHNITHMQSHPWKENMNSSSKDVQNGTNESSGQNFVGKGDEFGVKIAEIKDKTEDACDENLSLKKLFAYRKLKENQIFHNVVKKDKAMDAVDFVDLVSSVEVDAVEDKKVRPRKPSRYKKSPYENFTKKKGRRNKEFGLSKHGASFSEEEWYILQYIFHEQLDKRYGSI